MSTASAMAPTATPAASAAATEAVGEGGGEHADDATGEHGRNDGDHARERPTPLAAPSPETLNREPLHGRNAEQVRGEFRCGVEVVATQPSDPPRVTDVLDARLEHPLERHEADEGERRKEHEREGVER